MLFILIYCSLTHRVQHTKFIKYVKKQEKCFYKHFYKICEESSSWSREKIVNRNRPRPRDGPDVRIIRYGLYTIVTNILKDTAEKVDKSEQLGNFSREMKYF